LALLFNYNFPKNIWRFKDDKPYLKKFLKYFKKYINIPGNSKLFSLKDYENEIQEKTKFKKKPI